ncbi:hypothetical protein ED312_20360, partial [Sinomicrobium pectinilyticum]
NVSYNGTTQEFTYVDENGEVQTLNIEELIRLNESVTTLVNNNDGTYTYTNEEGEATLVDVPSDIIEQITNRSGDVYESITNLIDQSAGNVSYDGTTQEFTYVDENGESQSINLEELVRANETITTLVNNNDGTYTYTNEEGEDAVIDIGATEPWQVQGSADKATDNDQDIYQMGKVGIGTDNMLGTENANVVLAVNGSILTTSSIYADYVFEDYFEGESVLNSNYAFKSLKEVEDYINTNRHLPGIAKIDALMKNREGEYVINPTELSVQLLEKVEELYLHTIEQQKVLDQKDREIQELKKATLEMNERLERLEKLFKQ